MRRLQVINSRTCAGVGARLVDTPGRATSAFATFVNGNVTGVEVNTAGRIMFGAMVCALALMFEKGSAAPSTEMKRQYAVRH